jgi:hypothetical protein
MEQPETLRPIHCDQSVVLVVEDDVLVRNFARIVLEREGYFILTADHGQEALCLSQRYPGERGHIAARPAAIRIPTWKSILVVAVKELAFVHGRL